jgi:hypothetical protein
MQELIERLDKTEKQLENENNLVMSSALYAARSMAEELLEKEKEQIIDAMERTAMYVSAASLDKEIGKMTIEDLYNQTYNQDK